MAKRILVPLGKHEADQAVLPLVAPVARDSGATVRLLRVYPIPDLTVGSHGRTVAYVDQEMDSLSRRGVMELKAIADMTLDGVLEAAVDRGLVGEKRHAPAAEEMSPPVDEHFQA